MAQAGTGDAGTISVLCKCGKKLKAPASAVGRKAKCPKCGNVLTVEAPPPAPADELDDAMYDLAADAQSAAKHASPPPVAVAAPTAAKSTVAPKPAARGTAYVPALQTKVEVEKPKPSGSMLKGAIISAVFAFLGALIWFGIAKATNREIGWVAWGVGIAAGFGMMIGYNGTSVSAGAVAAAIAVAGILLGKWMVFSAVFTQTANEMTQQLERLTDDQKVLVVVTHDQLKKQGLDPDLSTEKQDEAARAEARKIIAKMDAATKAADVKKFSDELKEVRDQAMARVDRTSLFFKVMFSPIDLVFFVIAIASAFKVATFGGQVDNS